jgi:hypothetical protein
MFYHCFLICTCNFIIMKDSFVILVNLDSLPIEVTDYVINDQKLFSSSSVCVFFLLFFPHCCVQAICGVCPVGNGYFSGSKPVTIWSLLLTFVLGQVECVEFCLTPVCLQVVLGRHMGKVIRICTYVFFALGCRYVCQVMFN